MRVVLSIREGRLSSAALLRRLGNESWPRDRCGLRD